MTSNSYPIVIVTWLDSQGGNHWEFEKDLNPDYKLPHVSTFGMLIKETEEYVLLASSFMPQEPPLSNQLHSTMTIPKCSILSIKNLEEGELYVRSSD